MISNAAVDVCIVGFANIKIVVGVEDMAPQAANLHHARGTEGHNGEKRERTVRCRPRDSTAGRDTSGTCQNYTPTSPMYSLLADSTMYDFENEQCTPNEIAAVALAPVAPLHLLSGLAESSHTNTLHARTLLRWFFRR